MLVGLSLAWMTGCSWFNVDGDSEENLLEKLSRNDSGDSLLDKLKNRGKSETPPMDQGVNNKIRWDGEGIVLGEIDSSVFTTTTFLETIEQLTRDKRYSTINNLVRKYPDVALLTLQEANPLNQDRDALQRIASSFDTQWCTQRGTGASGWQSYLVDLTATSRKSKSLLDLKNRFWQHLRNHEPKQALALRLTRNIPQSTDVVVAAEFHRLEAIALMMDDQFDLAIQQLRKAIGPLQNYSAYQTSRLNLLLGEFYRHNGDLDLWKDSWANAVSQQAQLLNREGLMDPGFWNRAAYLRPAKTNWPSETIVQLRNHIANLQIPLPQRTHDESIVWLAIGLQHNERQEGQNAVLAFKKSEATSLDPAFKNQCHLFQARSMVLAGQPGAASAILIRLISQHEGTPLADRARAILGAMKLQNGAIGQGINLIESSIQTVDQWPRSERLRAQADYGLALLVSGKEDNGLRVLDQVQQEFQSLRLFDDLQQVLWNKAKYFEKTEQSQRLASARDELGALETLR